MHFSQLCLQSMLAVALAGHAHAQGFRLEEATIDGVHAAMAEGRLSCRTLVQGYLDRIAAYDKQGPTLNAIQTLNPRALEEADRLDAAFRTGGLVGPLHCVPLLVKDQIETRDLPTTYGSVLFRDFVPTRDATVVSRVRDAGAIVLAKTTMGEFAGLYVGSAFGLVRNAYDLSRNPSGSSSGTGAGIAANFGLAGIGEDSGGSIRGPAAVHALVGLRPTVFLVSRHGILPSTPSTDAIGPITRTVRDAAILLSVLAGYDPNDAATAQLVGQLAESYNAGLSNDGLRGARIGVLRGTMDLRTDTTSVDFANVRAVISQAVLDLQVQGAVVVDALDYPELVEVSSVFGPNAAETEAATDAYLAQHENAPYKTLRGILLSGRVNPWRATALAGALGRSINDQGYLVYLLGRERMRTALLKLMADERLDAVLYATFDLPPSEIASDVETNPAPDDQYSHGTNRGLSPILGFPAITIPAGYTPEGLPVGLELMGRPLTEAMLLRFAYAFEQATHHRHSPSTTPPLP